MTPSYSSVWQTDATPEQIRDRLAEVVDNVGLPPPFANGTNWMPSHAPSLPGSSRYVGEVTRYGFCFQLRPRAGTVHPFFLLCKGAIRRTPEGSRVHVSFRFHGYALFIYFVAFAWMLFLSFVAAPGSTWSTNPYPRSWIEIAGPPTLVLAAAVALAVFARWKVRRHRPALESVLRDVLGPGSRPGECDVGSTAPTSDLRVS